VEAGEQEEEEEEEEGEGDDDSDDGLKVRRPSSCRATLTLTRTCPTLNSHFDANLHPDANPSPDTHPGPSPSRSAAP
jgi:hypothetical protein